MNIYSHGFSRQLRLLSTLDSLKKTFEEFKESRDPGLAYYMSREPQPKHVQEFSVSHFSFTGVALPSADATDTQLQDYLDFYKSHLGRFFLQALPHAQVRVNDLTISLRVPTEQIARAEKVLQAFRDDAYWNDHFTKNDPELTKLLNAFSSDKQALERILRTETVKRQEQNGNTYFRLPLPMQSRTAFFSSMELGTTSIRRLLRDNNMPTDYESDFHRYYEDDPVKTENIRVLSNFLIHAFLLDSVYDYVKGDMENHYAQLHDKMDNERKEAFSRLENWYRSTHVNDDLKTFTPLFADNTLTSLPEKMELFLYSSNENNEWLARLIQPSSDNPTLDGYAAPVIGSFTKTVDESGRITVNDYFDVQLDLEAARATWLEHSDIEHSLQLDGYMASNSVDLDAYYVDEPAPPVSEPVPARASAGSQTMKTVTLEELFRQHGVTLPEEPETPVFEEREDPHAERPSRYRITKVDNRFNLFFSSPQGEVLMSNLDHDALRNALRQYSLETSFPCVVRYDTDQSRERQLDRPFQNASNYLVY